jgi:glycosyltransferase involved in cell wall biosynthesis
MTDVRSSGRPPRHRVLFVAQHLTGSGPCRVFVTLLRHLRREDLELHLAILHADDQFLSTVPRDVGVHALQGRRHRYAVPSLVRLVWDLRPQTVLSTGGMNNLLMLARPFLPRGIRLVIREQTTLSANLKHRAMDTQFWKWLHGSLYRRADRVVCVSDTSLEDLREQFHLPSAKLIRIYNPIDLAWLRELGQTAVSPYLTPGPHVVAAGRLSREKGFDVLLDAMAIAVKRIPSLQLTILGAGPLELELKKQACELGLTGAVRFLGFQSNPWPHMRHADLFVLSSRYEGLPNALLEALALGTPVVASDCPGAIREIQAGNDSVRLVPPEDPVSLANAMIAASGSTKLERKALVGLAEGLTRFDLRRALEQYSAVILGEADCPDPSAAPQRTCVLREEHLSGAASMFPSEP